MNLGIATTRGRTCASRNHGGTGAPSGNGYTNIYSTSAAFAALKADGSVTAWGDSGSGGSDAPAGSGYTKICSCSRINLYIILVSGCIYSSTI
jgi:hypothetical protein